MAESDGRRYRSAGRQVAECSKQAASRGPEDFCAAGIAGLESMTLTLAAVLGGFAMLVAAIAGLLVQRRALRESVEQFRLRSDQAPVLIWTARPDTTLDYINGFCEELTGRPLEQLRENGWLDFVHPEDLDRCLGTYMPAFEARRPFLLEYRLRHADGEYRWFLASGVPKVRTGRQLHRLCRLRHRHHRTEERRRSNSREPGCAQSERSGDSVSGRPLDRGAGGRAGAHRAGSARRRQPAAGWCFNRLQWTQAAVGRVPRQRRAATGARAASAADPQARTQRSTAFARSPPGRAAAPGTRQGPDLGTAASSGVHTVWRSRVRRRGTLEASRRMPRSASTESRRKHCGTSSHTPARAARM